MITWGSGVATKRQVQWIIVVVCLVLLYIWK